MRAWGKVTLPLNEISGPESVLYYLFIRHFAKPFKIVLII